MSKVPMRSLTSWLVTTALLATLHCTAMAQEISYPREFGGGGSVQPEEHVPHLTESQRILISQRLRQNILRLQSAGRYAQPRGVAPVLFSNWPVQRADHVTDYGVDAISNFVDHNSSFPNLLLDYSCGDRTYDTTGGYNHKGIDIYTWPFPWIKMNNNDVEIVSVAPGQIIGKDDGNSDMSCSFNGSNWNAVYIQHEDGSEAWYGHMKNGSLTPKDVGAMVSAGELLGVVGSSGNSTGPHLHLEIYDSLNNLIDPYAGACNALNVASWWSIQPGYYESSVNKLTTGSAAPAFNTCPNPGNPNTKKTFQSGNTVYFVTYYRDQLDTPASTYTITRPDGSTYDTWNHSSPVAHYSSSYWWWRYNPFNIAGNQTGIWKFTVAYASNSYDANFYMVDSCSADSTVNAQTISDRKTFAASNSVSTNGDVEVSSSGHATFLAQNGIAFNSGFSVLAGGGLIAATSHDVCD